MASSVFRLLPDALEVREGSSGEYANVVRVRRKHADAPDEVAIVKLAAKRVKAA
ncbi:MAG: hypothetical protein ACYS22_14200 [Planctomycetota bacterium]|jgi:hypothetical protein